MFQSRYHGYWTVIILCCRYTNMRQKRFRRGFSGFHNKQKSNFTCVTSSHKINNRYQEVIKKSYDLKNWRLYEKVPNPGSHETTTNPLSEQYFESKVSGTIITFHLSARVFNATHMGIGRLHMKSQSMLKLARCVRREERSQAPVVGDVTGFPSFQSTINPY